jgi:hypothetical protein
MTQSETLYHKLKRTTRRLSHIGYSAPLLVFSDASCVSMTDYEPSPQQELEGLLERDERPLGLIAPRQTLRYIPLVCPWTKGDEQARAELNSLARRLFWHRLPETPTDGLFQEARR